MSSSSGKNNLFLALRSKGGLQFECVFWRVYQVWQTGTPATCRSFWLCCLKVLRNLLCLSQALFPEWEYWIRAPLKSAKGVKVFSMDQKYRKIPIQGHVNHLKQNILGVLQLLWRSLEWVTVLSNTTSVPMLLCSSVSTRVAATIRKKYFYCSSRENNKYFSPAPTTLCFHINQSIKLCIKQHVSVH